MSDRPFLQFADIAKLLNVQVSTVTAYHARNQMPPATRCPCCGTGSVWEESVIRQWIEARASRAKAKAQRAETTKGQKA